MVCRLTKVPAWGGFSLLIGHTYVMKKFKNIVLLLLLYHVLLILLEQFQYAGRVELPDFKVYFVGQERHRTSILYFLNDPNVGQIQVNMKEKVLSSQGSFVQRKQIFGNLGA